MEVEELRANRWKVGLLSIGLLIGAVITFLTVPERPGLTGALGRVGVLLGAFWLAVPQLLKSPRLLKYLPWYLVLGAVLVVVFIRYVLVLIPLFLALGILSMFSGKKAKPRLPPHSQKQQEPPTLP